MPDRRFVITDLDPAAPEHGKLLALAPGAASGIALPTFGVGNTRPAVGTVIGESFYEENTKRGWVWDGSGWREIAASPVKTFATEALLKASSEQTGTFAVAADTGSIWVKRPTAWAQVGTREYATVAALLADTPPAGQLALARDDGSTWEMTTAGWRCTSVRLMANTAAVLGWAGAGSGAQNGDRALASDVDVVYVRTPTGWKPATVWGETEANIRAATWPIAGQVAIATDTGRSFQRTATGWVEEPIQHFATEALLLATAPANGVMAWADDTNVVFVRAAGAWKRLQGPQISVGTTKPTTPGAGDQHIDPAATTGGNLEVSTGTKWVPAVNPGDLWAVGSIQQSWLTEAQFAAEMGGAPGRWVLADGRAVPGSRFAAITGLANVPDLRGAFLRAAGTNSNGGWIGGAARAWQNDTTRRPNTPFTADSQGDHTHAISGGDHHHTYNDPLTENASAGGANRGVKGESHLNGEVWLHPGQANTGNAGHTHTVSTTGAHAHTITGGGDAETAPKHYAVNTFIKVN